MFLRYLKDDSVSLFEHFFGNKEFGKEGEDLKENTDRSGRERK